MRNLPLCTGLCLAACAGGPAEVRAERPDVAVVVALPPGSVLVPEVEAHEDTPPWRAAAVWWREALRQTSQFTVLDRPPSPGVGHAAVRLGADPAARRLTAWLVQGDATTPLAGGVWEAEALPAAIDQLARATREALGEATAAPTPVAAAFGSEPTLVDAVADAQLLLRDGGAAAARRLLLRSRARDGGNPSVLEGLAAAELLLGRPASAERIAQEALGYATRLTPTQQHRLARTLLLSRASQQPAAAPELDLELQRLGETFARERPHDPEGLLTRGLACNFRGEFADARSHLLTAAARCPDLPIVHYHLAWAELGLGNPAAAAAAFAAAAPSMPAEWLVVPRSIALFDAGQHEALAELHRELAAELEAQASPLLHDLRRMQAAHALLRGDDAAAVAILREDLRWLLQHSSVLDDRAGEFAQQGAVFVRLGAGGELPPLLAVLQQQRPGTALADTVAYLSGLVAVAQTGGRAEGVERQLARGGENVFGLLLAAFAHERAGELAAEHAALSRAARLDDTPMTKLLLARSLVRMGKQDEAAALLAALRAEMTRIHLRHRAQHPLLGPELAYAFRGR